MSASAVTISPLTDLAFNSPVHLTSGDTYALVLSTADTGSSDSAGYSVYFATGGCAADTVAVASAGSSAFTQTTSNVSLAFQVNLVEAPQIWTPPVLRLQPATISGTTRDVIENMGYNSLTAIQNGTMGGYLEERAAIFAGASATGEGANSSYLSAILDGSGVGLQQHISFVQQGQFAALYQNLGIIPTWTNNTVNIPAGVSTLTKAGASTLAIENYLVQIDGFSWKSAQKQAAHDFPIQTPR